MKKEISLLIITSLIALMFIYASFSKLLDVDEFRRSMYNQPFPHWMSNILMWTVPPVEILIAAGLMFERTKRRALIASSILMTLFTGYIAAVLLHFFPRVPCSCGGVLKSLGWGQHLIFNLFFLGISIWGERLCKTITMKPDSFRRGKFRPA